MTDIEIKAEEKIEELLNNIYHTLSRHPLISDQQRQLLPQQQNLMANLDQGSFLYQSLLRILAVDSYSTAIVGQATLYQQLCGMLTATLQSFNQLAQSIKNSQKRQVLQKFNKTKQSLVEAVKISQQMYPKNQYIEDQRVLFEQVTLKQNISQTIMSKLRNQNQELKRKAQSNELQIINLENKLTKLLKQHQTTERTQAIGSVSSNIELREQLILKQAEIQRMNEEFSVQIQKYNTVFEAMKRELQEMKGYQNVDLIQQIELLQTEIVRLRQERERDQIIIRQLRSDNTVFSSPAYYSPKQSNVRYNPRFNY